MAKTGTKIKLLKSEKILYFVLLPLLIVLGPIAVVYSQATLSESNIEVERLKGKINKQEGINEGLNMKINELASLDKILELASDYGLSYKYDNVRVVESE